MRALVILLTALTGCSYYAATLTLASTETVPMEMTVMQRDVSGTRCQAEWSASARPTLELVMVEALRNVPEANAIANLRALNTRYFVGFFNMNCMTVRGDAVKIGGP